MEMEKIDVGRRTRLACRQVSEADLAGGWAARRSDSAAAEATTSPAHFPVRTPSRPHGQLACVQTQG